MFSWAQEIEQIFPHISSKPGGWLFGWVRWPREVPDLTSRANQVTSRHWLVVIHEVSGGTPMTLETPHDFGLKRSLFWIRSFNSNSVGSKLVFFVGKVVAMENNHY